MAVGLDSDDVATNLKYNIGPQVEHNCLFDFTPANHDRNILQAYSMVDSFTPNYVKGLGTAYNF